MPPAMHRSEAWLRQQAEKGQRELQELFDASAASRRPAARMYPNLMGSSFRQVEIARRAPQQPASNAASRL